MFTKIFTAALLATTTAAAGNYSATFTQYGSGDGWGSGNCNTASAACGFYTDPGFSAAVSENLYGAGEGEGQGPACGRCYKLTATRTPKVGALPAPKSVVVMVNNLCPASSNPLCSQTTLHDHNRYGANVNFDLCINSGAAKAMFAGTGDEMAMGDATEVPCSMWKGEEVH